MTMQQMVKYFTSIDVLDDISKELAIMHQEDLRLVLETLLPEGSDIELAVKEIEQWKQELNLDIMKK